MLMADNRLVAWARTAAREKEEKNWRTDVVWRGDELYITDPFEQQQAVGQCHEQVGAGNLESNHTD